MKLVVLIPAYNEEPTIASIIESIQEMVLPVDEVCVLVVNDGSIDQTADVARQAGAIVVSHMRNRGVGAAFQTGLNAALKMDADILVNIDADGQFAPVEISKIIKPILEGSAEFVAGDRFTTPNGERRKPSEMSWVKYWGNHQMTRLVSALTGGAFTDVSSGFRAYSRSAMLHLNLLGRFTYTQESFLDLASKEVAITQIPITVRYFPDRQSRVASSIVKYAWRTAWIIMRAYRDYNPLSFFGLIGTVIFLIGCVADIFVLAHWMKTNAFSPHISVGLAGIYLNSIGILFWVVALFTDMLDRQRITIEKCLFLTKEGNLKDRVVSRTYSDRS